MPEKQEGSSLNHLSRNPSLTLRNRVQAPGRETKKVSGDGNSVGREKGGEKTCTRREL